MKLVPRPWTSWEKVRRRYSAGGELCHHGVWPQLMELTVIWLKLCFGGKEEHLKNVPGELDNTRDHLCGTFTPSADAPDTPPPVTKTVISDELQSERLNVFFQVPQRPDKVMWKHVPSSCPWRAAGGGGCCEPSPSLRTSPAVRLAGL